MKFDVRVEAKALNNKLKNISGAAERAVAELVNSTAKQLQAEVKTLIGKPTGGRGTGRSRPGQPPRRDTGRLQTSVEMKQVDKTKAYVTVNAKDDRGQRYGWMLESGTKNIKKRPFVKKAQRKIKRQFQRSLVDLVRSL